MSATNLLITSTLCSFTHVSLIPTSWFSADKFEDLSVSERDTNITFAESINLLVDSVQKTTELLLIYAKTEKTLGDGAFLKLVTPIIPSIQQLDRLIRTEGRSIGTFDCLVRTLSY